LQAWKTNTDKQTYNSLKYSSGCIGHPQRSKKIQPRNFRAGSSHGQRGHVTTAIPVAAFSAWFGSAIIPYVVRSTIGLLRDSYAVVFAGDVSSEHEGVLSAGEL